MTQDGLASSGDGVILDKGHKEIDKDATAVTRIEKDLPDPLETTGSSPPTDPDELVAQLAGDAIDRLLEETEKGLVPPRPKPQDDPLNDLESAVSTVPHSSEPLTLSDSAKSPVTSSDRTGLGSETVGPESSGTVPDSGGSNELRSSDVLKEVQAGLDSVLGGLGKETGVETTPVPPAGAEVPASESPEQVPETSLPMPPAVDVPPDIANDDGHGGSVEPLPEAPARTTESGSESDPTVDARKLLLDESRGLSRSPVRRAIVLPLKLINAPFSGLSDQTRDVLGQIGLITLLNALAILVYVLIFR